MFDKIKRIMYNANKGCDNLEQESTYVLYTDASFDDFSKIGTYAIIVMQENKVLKQIAKKCRIQMKSSTECEIFAVYQAINIVLNMYLKKGKKQKFKLKTDSIDAKNFFLKKQYSQKIFLDNLELSDNMKKTYTTLCRKVSKNEGSFSLNWIPREANRMAHKWSNIVFQRLRECDGKKEVLLINKSLFLEILLNEKKEQNEIIKYLLNNSNENKIILKTQKEMSNALNIPIFTINRILNNLIELDVLEKVKNGMYVILI